MIERRAAAELHAAGNRLVGHAAVFDSMSQDLGGWHEIVRPGTFRRSLSEGDDVVALVHHRPEMPLGRRSSGTLRLSEDQHGLAFEIDLPDTQTGHDIKVSVDRGDISGASFAFTVPDGGDRWTQRNNGVLRELLDIDLHDITVTPLPAYSDTSVARRALVLHSKPRLRLCNMYLETIR